MNENIDLTKILKDCPKGFKLYSLTRGEVAFCHINKNHILYPIEVEVRKDIFECYSSEGKIYKNEGECTLVPSKDQRDWSKFTAPWYKKDKFDPKTLKAFDRVIVWDEINAEWFCTNYSHRKKSNIFIAATTCGNYLKCIPYNDDTKHLVGTTDKTPEYYRYWEE